MKRCVLHLTLSLLAVLGSMSAWAGPGDWPEPRQNPQLTGIQPMPGKMASAPVEAAKLDLGRSAPGVRAVELPERKGWIGLALVAGSLQGYDPEGKRLWECHPPGLNFSKIEATGDFDRDGRIEAALMAGRSSEPFAAAVLVSVEDGRVLWRYDVEPMSYAWYLYVGPYLPESDHEQIIVVEHAYPPDKDNGYIVLFDFPEEGKPPVQLWRYDFNEYTCFPSLLQTDLDGDGVREIVIETHSRAWFLDARTGELKHFAKWDVSPANVRSYGLVEFVDLNGDGREDFLCIATFSQHHEVLLNKDGRMELAWAHGWPESVTTRHVASVWPEPPYGDVDGDGRIEVVVSMYNSENEEAWLVRVYDAVTGELKYRQPGMIAAGLEDGDGDGSVEILANASDDPAESVLKGARLLDVRDGKLVEVWRDDSAVAVKPGGARRVGKGRRIAHFERGDQAFTLEWEAQGNYREVEWVKPPKKDKPEFRNLPSVAGPQPLPELLAVRTPEGVRLLVFLGGVARRHSFKDGQLEPVGQYPSSCLPAAADLDGDDWPELVTATVSPDAQPVVQAVSLASEAKSLWRREYPPADRVGFPHGRTAYLRLGRFTGKPTPDVYAWTGTPLGRSAMLDGRTGEILWEMGEMKDIERYAAPTMNLASVYDFNGDVHEDLVFTAPDYFCVADGPTGKLLLGPLYPPEVFKQPSQGLYTFPAILARDGEPLVALVAGHYFQGVMTLKGEPQWHKLPVVGVARCAQEAFLRLADGTWIMGFGRQNGRFACVNVADGSVRWELPLEASASDAAVCDIDGDGQSEFIFGTSHGRLCAVGDGGDRPREVWAIGLGAGVGAPIAADFDGDGASEIAVATMDGYVRLFDAESE